MACKPLAYILVTLSLCAVCWALDGVLYEPFSQQQYFCLGRSEVAEDLRAIERAAASIRLKSLAACPKSTFQILEFALKHRMQVLLGVFINGRTQHDDREFAMLQRVLKRYDSRVISGVVVGDGLVFNLGLTPMEVAAFIERGKAVVKKSGRKLAVGTAESWDILEFGANSTVTARVSDFLCMNMQPYWGGTAADCAQGASCQNIGALVDAKAEVLALKFKKTVVICNTGWPTKGEKCCGNGRPGSLDGYQAVPSVANAQLFYNQLTNATNLSGRIYYIGDAFDATWKRTHSPCTDCNGLSNDFKCGVKRIRSRECEVVYNFGLFTVDRKLKIVTA